MLSTIIVYPGFYDIAWPIAYVMVKETHFMLAKNLNIINGNKRGVKYWGKISEVQISVKKLPSFHRQNTVCCN